MATNIITNSTNVNSLYLISPIQLSLKVLVRVYPLCGQPWAHRASSVAQQPSVGGNEEDMHV